MKNVLTSKYSIFTVGFFLSVTIHFLFFQLFTITLPTIKESYKPSITFLGSILATHDGINSKNSSSNLTDNNANLNTIDVREKMQGPAESVFKDPAIKQLSKNPSSKIQKNNIKSTFLPETQINPPLKMPIESGIAIETLPYEPLKFKNHD